MKIFARLLGNIDFKDKSNWHSSDLIMDVEIPSPRTREMISNDFDIIVGDSWPFATLIKH